MSVCHKVRVFKFIDILILQSFKFYDKWWVKGQNYWCCNNHCEFKINKNGDIFVNGKYWKFTQSEFWVKYSWTKWVTENLCSCVKVWACVSIPFSTNAWCLVIDLSLLYLLSSNRRVKLSPTTCVASLYFWNKFFITQVQNHMGG